MSLSFHKGYLLCWCFKMGACRRSIFINIWLASEIRHIKMEVTRNQDSCPGREKAWVGQGRCCQMGMENSANKGGQVVKTIGFSAASRNNSRHPPGK